MRTDPPPTLPPSRGPEPAGHRVRARGGGWLLPEVPLPSSAPVGEPHAPGRSLSTLLTALDASSALDRCRWLRLQAEAARWAGPPAPP